jgi:hypothetical protein
MEWFIMSQQVFSLLSRHQQIDEALRLERRRRWPDVMRMMRLKTIKKSLNDRLSLIIMKNAKSAIGFARPQ